MRETTGKELSVDMSCSLSTPIKEAIEKEESTLKTHRSNQTIDLSYKQVDLDDTSESVGQYLCQRQREIAIRYLLSDETVSTDRAQGPGKNYGQDTRPTARETVSTSRAQGPGKIMFKILDLKQEKQ